MKLKIVLILSLLLSVQTFATQDVAEPEQKRQLLSASPFTMLPIDVFSTSVCKYLTYPDVCTLRHASTTDSVYFAPIILRRNEFAGLVSCKLQGIIAAAYDGPAIGELSNVKIYTRYEAFLFLMKQLLVENLSQKELTLAARLHMPLLPLMNIVEKSPFTKSKKLVYVDRVCELSSDLCNVQIESELIDISSVFYFPQEELDHVDKSKKHKLELDYKSCISLPRVPACVGQLSFLTSLYLYSPYQRNKVHIFPEFLGLLAKLKKLDMQQQLLTRIPPELGQLILLVTLDLSQNKLTEFPACIGKLTNLIKLDLSNNEIEHVPKNIGALVRMKRLDLSRNKISLLPVELNQLLDLRTLDLIQNNLSEFPLDLIALKGLHNVMLSGNTIRALDLPETIADLLNMQGKEPQYFHNHEKSPFGTAYPIGRFDFDLLAPMTLFDQLFAKCKGNPNVRFRYIRDDRFEFNVFRFEQDVLFPNMTDENLQQFRALGKSVE